VDRGHAPNRGFEGIRRSLSRQTPSFRHETSRARLERDARRRRRRRRSRGDARRRRRRLLVVSAPLAARARAPRLSSPCFIFLFPCLPACYRPVCLPVCHDDDDDDDDDDEDDDEDEDER
jgi:hypothetical protein